MSVKRKLIAITAVFILLIALSTGLAYYSDSVADKNSYNENIAVQINKIKHQIDENDITGANSSLDSLQENIDANQYKKTSYLYLIPLGLSGIYVLIAFAYIYRSILRPFDKLHDFASDVAAGNLDTPLEQDRGQYFGEFTWAFDSMRKEITKARESEKKSIENNKTVIATLSHDIKTPISSIRAYSEALEANLDTTPEKRSKYLNTIISKCDEVSKLTDDLFLHSVSDMDRMSVSNARLDINEFMTNALASLNTYSNVNLRTDIIGKTYIMADPQRLMQICENIVGNSNKYAKTNIDVCLYNEDDNIVIEFKDYGSGIPEENLPFITQKFYRGSNVEGVQGSGLGLYIVNYLCDKMNGRLSIDNTYENEVRTGLQIKVSFAKVS